MRSPSRMSRTAALGATLFAAGLLTAAPASAAPVSLSPESCTALNGGTFTLVKGLKTCTYVDVITIEADNGPIEIRVGPLSARYFLRLSGEVWVETILVQRGKGSIKESYGTEVDRTSTTVLEDSRSCEELVGGSYQVVDVAICDQAGLYDLVRP